MYLSRLILSNFRNFSHAEWEPHPANNILYGGNGQGKTNLLEAIYFLSTTRSFRTSRDKELINWAAAEEEIATSRVEGEIFRNQRKLHLELALMGRKGDTGTEKTSLSPDLNPLTGIIQKKIRLNGIPRAATEVIGQVNIVLFSTHDIEIIGGAPSLRRRYIDDIKTQADSHYLRTLASYNRVLEQRNHLLRLIQEDRAHPDQLEFWNRELVDKGAYLIKQRWSVAEEINALAHPLHLNLTSGKEELALIYLPNLEGLSPSTDEETIKQIFAAKLKQYQPRELGAGMSLVGPHRDDLLFLVNGANLGIYGSRGQQRTLALSLKLAEAKYLHKIVGESPVILLDDTLSELDAQRRRLILEALPAYGQVITTATDLDRFESNFIASSRVFCIKNGTVIPE